jgi:hypothetical protein
MHVQFYHQRKPKTPTNGYHQRIPNGSTDKETKKGTDKGTEKGTDKGTEKKN